MKIKWINVGWNFRTLVAIVASMVKIWRTWKNPSTEKIDEQIEAKFQEISELRTKKHAIQIQQMGWVEMHGEGVESSTSTEELPIFSTEEPFIVAEGSVNTLTWSDETIKFELHGDGLMKHWEGIAKA